MNKTAPTRSCGVDGQLLHKDQSSSSATVEALNKEIAFLKQRLDRRNFKISKVAEAYVITFCYAKLCVCVCVLIDN